MKSLDRHSLEEQTRLVSRYVAGDLARSERAEFEAWLVASPELAAEVEMERRLRRGISSAARRGWLKRGAPREHGRDRRWPYAVAAGIVGTLAVGLVLWLPRDGAESAGVSLVRTGKAQPTSATRTVRLGAVRGTGNSPDVLVTLNDAPADLVFEPDVVVLTCANGMIELECPGGTTPQNPQYPEYEMDLVNRHRATLAWRSPRQLPVARTQLAFTLRDPGSLDAGEYDLIVRGHSADHAEVVARFWLRVAPQ